MGEIAKEKILEVVDKFPWTELLTKLNEAEDHDIHFSPSLEFENVQTRHGLAISIVDGENGNEFYIFYRRPKEIVKLFGLLKSMDNNYTSERMGQSSADVRDAVSALIKDDLTTLEKRWG